MRTKWIGPFQVTWSARTVVVSLHQPRRLRRLAVSWYSKEIDRG